MLSKTKVFQKYVSQTNKLFKRFAKDVPLPLDVNFYSTLQMEVGVTSDYLK